MSSPAMMTAVLAHRYGPPDTLRIGRIPRPEPGPGEVLLRLRASTVSRTDTATLRGHPFFARVATGLLRPRMPVLGMDFAGEVDTIGAGVTAFRPGDRVFGLSPDRFGAHAEYLCIAADAAVARIPDHLDYHQAVIGEGAWYASSTTRLLSDGQSCLIYGASGAIGTMAVQLARTEGAHVTAVVGDRHLELARQLGADRVVNYQREDVTTLPDRFDLVFDAVGKTSWSACRHLLKPGGIFAATDLGPFWSNILLELWHRTTGRRRVRIPFPKDAPGFIRQLERLMAQDRIRGVFDRHYKLDRIIEAFRYVETGRKTGIVVLDF